MIAAYSFLDTAVIPPMPPIVNAALGTIGMVVVHKGCSVAKPIQ